MTRLRALWDRMRGTYWAVPSGMASLSIVFSVVMIEVDRAVPTTLVRGLSWVYTGGPEGARAVLSTIAASMMTVAGVTFSITIVALTLASQQFGPRLLRNFLRDLGNQITLGTFIATFIYCLLVLRTVRGTDDVQFVPHLAVTAGVVLAMLSLGVLIFFIHHVATSIQASQVIASVAADLAGAIDRLFPEEIGRGEEGPPEASRESPPLLAFDAHTVTAMDGGYVQAIDSARLLAFATERKVVLRVDSRPGTFVRRGSPLVSVAQPFLPSGDFDQSARGSFMIGVDRTGTQDLEFFIDQLVELAVRALSPGINDPATARICVDRLGEALCQLAGRRMPSPCRRDDDGVLRIVAAPVTFSDVCGTAFTEIARYGRSSVSVSCRLLDVVRDVGTCVRLEEERVALVRLADFVGDRPREAFENEMDRAELSRSYRAALAVLRGPGGAGVPSSGGAASA